MLGREMHMWWCEEQASTYTPSALILVLVLTTIPNSVEPAVVQETRNAII